MDHGRYLGMQLMGCLPERVVLQLVRERPRVVEGQQMDALLQFVSALRRKLRAPRLTDGTVEQARNAFRREMRAYAGPKTPVQSVRDFDIATAGGSLAVRHYAPLADGVQPLLVFLHGGGFTIGDLDTHDEPCRILCLYSRMHVLSVAYRLAPEHPVPAALDDSHAAVHWARAHAASLGADPARVTIGGDSAGGSLSAVTSARMRDEGTPVAAQLLIYPAMDAVTQRGSHSLYGGEVFLSGHDGKRFTAWYTQGTEIRREDPRVSALLAPRLDGLPPTLVITGGFDMLRDEGEAYAEAVRLTGARAELLRFPGMVHGFINLTGIVPAARAATIEVAQRWRSLIDEACP
ncbi:MAG: nlhH 2 [Gemmatimonadetes bacterium]|nr:nlhH 2 [Gemmatimonadota bacterium]